jgi:hypothetical protein
MSSCDDAADDAVAQRLEDLAALGDGGDVMPSSCRSRPR